MSEKRPAPTGSAIIRLCALVARVSYADDEDERVRESMIEAMLAARRELDAMLAISRRRCDGCRYFTTSLDGYDNEPGCERGYHANSTEPHESCSRWEAKR